MKQKLKFLTFLAFISGLLCLPTTGAAYDMFMKIEGIEGVEGESTDPAHPQWINVYSFSHSISNAPNALPRHAELVIEKRIDKTTPAVNLNLNRGIEIPKITVHFQKNDEMPVVFYKVEMEKVFVTSAQTHGAVGNDVIFETLTLNYGKITWTYYPLDAKGGAGAPIISDWDLETNKGS